VCLMLLLHAFVKNDTSWHSRPTQIWSPPWARHPPAMKSARKQPECRWSVGYSGWVVCLRRRLWRRFHVETPCCVCATSTHQTRTRCFITTINTTAKPHCDNTYSTNCCLWATFTKSWLHRARFILRRLWITDKTDCWHDLSQMHDVCYFLCWTCCHCKSLFTVSGRNSRWKLKK